MTKVSVILPVYNGQDYLPMALDSILWQTMSDFELLVVDDGSSDATPAIIKRYSSLDSRVVPIRKESGGLVDALNLGLERACGDYIARMDADDICFPHRFLVQLECFSSLSDVIAVSNSAVVIAEDGQITGQVVLAENRVADLFSVPAHEHYLLHPFLMVRRDMTAKVGGYRHVTHSEDADLYYRLEEEGRLFNINDVLGKYRLHGSSVSGSAVKNGRVQSVSAQLAALSARRRRLGQKDLDFTRESSLKLQENALDIVALATWAAGEFQLDAEEAHWLTAASVAKFIHHENWRPYSMSTEDASAIRRYIHGASKSMLGEENYKELLRHWLWVIKQKLKYRMYDGNSVLLLRLLDPVLTVRAGLLAAKRKLRRAVFGAKRA